MGTEFRVQRSGGFRRDDIEPLLRSKSYRGFDENFKQYSFGFIGQASGHDVPEFTLWFDGPDLGITAYEMTSTAWEELSSLIQGFVREDPSVRITSWDDDEDMFSYFQ
ncbi:MULTISPECIES: hypothetical protein [Sorangium]|uniref:Uncharacterized protein n=1 Tax=Sorangium cellulosum TaxID=56 RepID=A0A4P2R5Y9_SORCE|nr:MULTISPECIES: hypothetical protein [Sorangium]AUX38549.1 uncharacterized protein SOCE836_107960 [Sorangium cellulosum]WCQ97837.1 hypothetical protein NQZ70_10635 [Sorangium sp. Soce836]